MRPSSIRIYGRILKCCIFGRTCGYREILKERSLRGGCWMSGMAGIQTRGGRSTFLHLRRQTISSIE
ncbi:hypothetical protein CPB83DRAFT_848727 [Crepidotus variabilis]|uniref:Uncharacterized protein n=1 Tax=Crepidotus variabilis TaxID=179855 RepID=A0A9P6JTG9_9AGAR|nr:hypothetical protein CPB83DRAFT_848727 [Crepidotus variabilis]